MNCLYFGCQNPAEYPYPCCDSFHGMKLREDTTTLKSYQEGKLKISDLFTSFLLRNEPWTLEKIIYLNSIL